MAAASPALTLHTSSFVDDFIDVTELNAGASDVIAARIEEVRTAARENRHVVTRALAILGPAGAGKTHIVARVRRTAGPQATLVLVRPYFGATLSLRDVLATSIDQLCRRPSQASVSQLEMVTSYWLAPEDGALFPSATALETSSLPPAERAERLERAVLTLVERLPQLAPVAHLIRALLGATSLEQSARWAELAWLSGREPRATGDSATSSVLGDGDVLHVLTVLSVLAAPVAPLVIVFDQLENLATEGVERVLGYGNVVSELVDSVPSLTVAQLALTSEWLQFIEPHLSLSQRSRVSGDKIILDLPTEKERKLLLRAWQDRLSPPASQSGRKKRLGHPLSPEQVEHLLTAPGMTPRLLATAFARAMAGKEMFEATAELPPEPKDARAAVRELWDNEHSRIETELEERRKANAPVDAAEIAEGMGAALAFVPRLEVETRAERERYFTTVRAPGSELVIVHLTAVHHKSVGAGLARAADLARSSKVAVLRESRFELPESWASVEEKRTEFERMPNARWLWLSNDDVVRCLTLARLASLARAKRLRPAGSEEPIALDALHAELATLVGPAEWTSTAAITRWLDDVPRESRSTARTESSPEPAPAATPPSDARPKADEPLDALRSWLRVGRTVGKDAVSYYADKLARRLRRG